MTRGRNAPATAPITAATSAGRRYQVTGSDPTRKPRARRPARASPGSGPGRPVISSTCSTAWCTSRSSPDTSTRPARSAALRERRRPRVVDHVEDHGHAGRPARAGPAAGPRRGSSRPARRRPRRGRPRAGVRRPRAPCGWRAAAATVSAARPASRTSSVTRAAAEVGEREQRRRGRRAPAEHHGAVDRSVVPLAQRRRHPGDVGVVARPAAVARARRCWPRRPAGPVSLTSSSSGSTARFSGIVSDSPRHDASSPARKPGRPASVDLVRRRRPSPDPARRTPPGAAPATASARSGCRGRRSGRPGSAAVGLGTAVLLELGLVLQEGVVVLGELGLAGAQVDRHVVEPAARRSGAPRPRSPRRPAPRSASAAGRGSCRCCTASRPARSSVVSADAEVAVDARSSRSRRSAAGGWWRRSRAGCR